jgi:hypothetical protein
VSGCKYSDPFAQGLDLMRRRPVVINLDGMLSRSDVLIESGLAHAMASVSRATTSEPGSSRSSVRRTSTPSAASSALHARSAMSNE